MTKKTSEGAVPVQEIQTPAVIPVRHFMRSTLAIGFVLLCIIIGILFHQLNNPIYPKQATTYTRPSRVSAVQTKIPETRPIITEALPPVQETALIDTPPTPPVVELSGPQSSLSEEVSTPAPRVDEVHPLPLVSALQLRDKLALGEPCREDVERLLYNPIPTTQKNLLLEKLVPVCIKGDFWNTLESTFRQSKKQALITYYHLNNPMWLAYIKSVWARMIDIQRIHPTKMRPKDFLAQAQEALLRHRLDEVLSNIQKLPPVLKAHFGDFMKQAQAYLSAQEIVENMVLSFDEGRK